MYFDTHALLARVQFFSSLYIHKRVQVEGKALCPSITTESIGSGDQERERELVRSAGRSEKRRHVCGLDNSTFDVSCAVEVEIYFNRDGLTQSALVTRLSPSPSFMREEKRQQRGREANACYAPP